MSTQLEADELRFDPALCEPRLSSLHLRCHLSGTDLKMKRVVGLETNPHSSHPTPGGGARSDWSDYEQLIK